MWNVEIDAFPNSLAMFPRYATPSRNLSLLGLGVLLKDRQLRQRQLHIIVAIATNTTTIATVGVVYRRFHICVNLGLLSLYSR